MKPIRWWWDFLKGWYLKHIFWLPPRHRGWIETGFILVSPLPTEAIHYWKENPLELVTHGGLSWGVPSSRPRSNKVSCHCSHRTSFNNEYFGTRLMGLRIVLIAHMLNSTVGPQHRMVPSKSSHFCGPCPAPSQPSSSCIFDLFSEHIHLPGHAVFSQSRLALYFASEWAVPAKEVTHCGYSCLPLAYKGLVQVLLLLWIHFFLLSFWDATIKKEYY